AINSALPAGTPRLSALHDIFDGARCFFNGVPELDPYGPRDPGGFLGLYSGGVGSAVPQWPAGEAPRVFAYLHSEYRHLDTALAALAASGARCVVYLFGSTPEIRQKYAGPSVVFSTELLDIDQAVQAADLCVCHANFGTVMAVLRGGKPLLLLPYDLEKFLSSASLEKLGVGRMVRPEGELVDIGGTLAQMLGSPAFTEAAKAFALGHREPSVDTIIAGAARRIEALAQGQPG
ncbi:MAG TPA: glycosyltransferase, partial [Burkholderiales bacterium]|nr:glycosyltransferase [Burkholderiales bacterium]